MQGSAIHPGSFGGARDRYELSGDMAGILPCLPHSLILRTFSLCIYTKGWIQLAALPQHLSEQDRDSVRGQWHCHLQSLKKVVLR